MVVHPHRPRSRASIGEFAVLMAVAHGRLEASVAFLKPPGFTSNWAKTKLWRSAAAIPGVSGMVDSGREARLFGAATSRQTMGYDRNERLSFSGGITAARGHLATTPARARSPRCWRGPLWAGARTHPLMAARSSLRARPGQHGILRHV
jgi:hypothetical protein